MCLRLRKRLSKRSRLYSSVALIRSNLVLSKAFGDRVEMRRESRSCRTYSLRKGLSFLKRLRQKSPKLAFLWNPDHPDNEQRAAQLAAQTLGLQLHLVEVRRTEDFDLAFRAANDAGADSLYVVTSRQTLLNIKRIVQFATTNRIPLAGGFGDWAKEGGLLSYGPDAIAMSARAANYIDKIFKGANPADLPVEQPAKFQLIINLTTAKALGLTIPYSLLSRADQLIE